MVWQGPWGGGSGPRRCSFCGRRQAVVAHLVRARETYICDECVAIAQQLLAEADPEVKVLRLRPRRRAPADRDAAEAAVEEAFETVYGPGVAPADRLARVEAGEQLVSVEQQIVERFPGLQASLDVSVEQVRFLSEDEAEVSFVLLMPGPGPPMIPVAGRFPSMGYALLVDGQWKVSRETYCALVARVGIQCPPPVSRDQ